jgi:cyclopropane-fatty-acyl-phospholipid synthase
MAKLKVDKQPSFKFWFIMFHMARNLEPKFNDLLKGTGIKINGRNPWDIQVHNDRLYVRILQSGTLGFGEAYMDGWWDVKDMPEFSYRIAKSNIYDQVNTNPLNFLLNLKTLISNAQTKTRSKKVAQEHYDLDNELFESFLDKNMQYTCGYWKNAQDLERAQVDKLNLICKKLGLKSGMTLLDIGCGWGNLAGFAAQNYKVKATGITISKEQLAYCKEKFPSKNIRFILKDYREMTGKFDRIVCVGMIEHVGYKNYRKFMKKINELLKDNGLFLLHTIGSNLDTIHGDAWVDKYIFPNGMLPSISYLGKAWENLLVMEDWHNFGLDYYKTLIFWMKKFDRAWPALKNRYDERFYRMWRYYLHMFA